MIAFNTVSDIYKEKVEITKNTVKEKGYLMVRERL